jgi:hypothetical protein
MPKMLLGLGLSAEEESVFRNLVVSQHAYVASPDDVSIFDLLELLEVHCILSSHSQSKGVVSGDDKVCVTGYATLVESISQDLPPIQYAADLLRRTHSEDSGQMCSGLSKRTACAW